MYDGGKRDHAPHTRRSLAACSPKACCAMRESRDARQEDGSEDRGERRFEGGAVRRGVGDRGGRVVEEIGDEVEPRNLLGGWGGRDRQRFGHRLDDVGRVLRAGDAPPHRLAHLATLRHQRAEHPLQLLLLAVAHRKRHGGAARPLALLAAALLGGAALGQGAAEVVGGFLLLSRRRFRSRSSFLQLGGGFEHDGGRMRAPPSCSTNGFVCHASSGCRRSRARSPTDMGDVGREIWGHVTAAADLTFHR